MTEKTSRPDEMAIDIPAKDGTLLRLTMRQDDAGTFGDDSPVEIQIHTSAGLRPAVSYKAMAFRHAADWRPGKPSQLQIHDLDPGLTIERNWLTTITDWILMAADTDIDIWSENE